MEYVIRFSAWARIQHAAIIVLFGLLLVVLLPAAGAPKVERGAIAADDTAGGHSGRHAAPACRPGPSIASPSGRRR